MKLKQLTWLLLLVALLGACSTVADPEASLEPQVGVTNITVVNKGGNSTWIWPGKGFLKWTPTGGGNGVAEVITSGTYTVGAYGRDGVWEGCDSVRNENPKHYCTVTIVPGEGGQPARSPTVTFRAGPGSVTFKPPTSPVTTLSLNIEGNGVKKNITLTNKNQSVSLPEGTYNLSGRGCNPSYDCSYYVSSPSSFTITKGESKTLSVYMTRN